MKKTTHIFSELLVLFLIIGLSIMLVGTEISEKNKVSDVQGNAVYQTEGSPKSGLAPVNPEFIKYQKNKIFTQMASSSGGHKTGLMPSPVDLHHLHHISTLAASDPTYYDLRALNKVSSIKDQGNAGACWAFATYASLESYLMPGENWDFSENNMKNLLSSEYPEGFDRDANNDGGNSLMSTAYLARWSGSVAESDDPYSDISTSSPTGLPVQKHVQDVIFLSDRQGPLDNNEIKSAVQKYGAVYTSMYWDDAYLSPTTYSYYYDVSSYSNHAVDIVGWNDSFDKNNFSKVPPGNGAFIVKNSWGPGWGENGYFYISYYDSNIGTNNAVFKAENTTNYRYIYQYDPLGLTSCYGYYNPIGWCANIFTAKSNEVLKAVSFYMTDLNCNYVISVYSNPGSKPISQAGPVFTQSGKSSTAGYHTIPLDSGVQLKAGQKFSVVLKLTTPGFNYPIPLEDPDSGYSSKATAHAGESFVSPDGKTWTDIMASYSNTNVCIKAFTNLRTGLPVANFSATPTSGIAPLTVLFTDTSTGSPTSWYWDFGDGTNSKHVQTAAHTFTKPGTYTVTLTVTNAAGSDVVTKSSYITVQAKPTATFTANLTSGKAPLSVQFTSTTTGNPTDYYWIFEPSTSSDWNSHQAVTARHTFTKPGKYTVSLMVTNGAGSNTVTKTNYITVTAPPIKPVASFTANKVSGKYPLTVIFTYTGTGGTPDSYLWDFGDQITSTNSKTATHRFTKAGTYTVSLKVGNSAGSDVATKTKYIVVK
jgi:C1A family cysteine protease/PKD repeat protein